MKIYISADIEGVAGITHRDEIMKEHPSYGEFRDRMTNEVVAACEGAIEAGASDILIQDAHGTGRNILAEQLPSCTRLIRGWSGHPFDMVQELDKTFDAVICVGYHSKAGSDGSPLAHTLNGAKVAKIEVNGEIASEFLIHAYAAASVGVPVAFLSGDAQICRDALLYDANIHAVEVSQGVGASTISIAPILSRQLIKAGVTAALKGDLRRYRMTMPEHFKLQMTYVGAGTAYRASWYPGMHRVGPLSVNFESTEYFEILRALCFVS